MNEIFQSICAILVCLNTIALDLPATKALPMPAVAPKNLLFWFTPGVSWGMRRDQSPSGWKTGFQPLHIFNSWPRMGYDPGDADFFLDRMQDAHVDVFTCHRLHRRIEELIQHGFLSFPFKSWWTSFHSLVSCMTTCMYFVLGCKSLTEKSGLTSVSSAFPGRHVASTTHSRCAWCLRGLATGISSDGFNSRGWHGLLGRQRLTATVVVFRLFFL